MDARHIAPKDLGLPEALPLPKRRDWRIGMVGFGGIASGAHAPAYRDAGWRIVAVADPDPAAQERARTKFGVERTYADYRQLIADPEVEIVDLLTQPTIRGEVIEEAGKAGKPIVTEKPSGLDIADCLRNVATAEKRGIRFAVHQNYRWHKMNFLARHIVAAGLIGDPFFASISIFGKQDVSLAQHPFYSQCDDFLTLQWNNHLADLLRYFTGKDPVRVWARTARMAGQNFKSDNLLTIAYDFGAGLSGQVLHSELLRSSLGGVQCRLDGSKGSILFDFGGSLTLESSEVPGGPAALDTAGLTYLSSFAGSMGDFLIAIENGSEPQVSGRRNLATMRTVFAEVESARAGGKWVETGNS